MKARPTGSAHRRSPLRVCFFTERQVGLNSAAAVLEQAVLREPGVDVTWRDVTYYQDGGLVERLPILPRGAKAILRGFLQTGDGLRCGPFDALFFFTQSPAVFRQAALARTPTCVWTDVTPMQLDEFAWAYGHAVSRSRWVRAGKRAAVARTFRLARRCLGWSDWTRRSFVEDYGVSENKTAVVPPGIDLSCWDGSPRHEHSGPFRLVFVGGHFERKGGRVLLDVFRERFRGKAELSIVTRDPIPEEPGVRVHHGISAGSDEHRRLLRSADAFVLPTLADCHSIASLEAMASGLPVVLTRVGAGPEIVEDGASGFVVPPGDGPALAQALGALIEDRARAGEMGARGRALVERHFDGRTTAARIVEELHIAAGR